MGGFANTISTIGQVGSSIMGGFAASNADEFNASVSKAHAQAIRQAADLDIYRQRKAAGRLRSAQQAGYAKAGVLLEGSPLEVMIDSAAEAEIDIAITDYNARVGMAQAEAEAEQYKKRAKSSMYSGMMGGLKTLLTSDLFTYEKKPKPSSTGEMGKGYYSWAAQQTWRG